MEKYFEDGCYSCGPGIELIAKVLAGECQMKYTKAEVGQGYLGQEENPKNQETVKEKVMDAKIAAVTNPVGGECQVTVQINSADVTEGFYATGIMLYASDPDGSDVPYTYLVLEHEPEWIRPKTSDIGKLATFDLIVAVGAVDKVTAVIDTDSVMTRQGTENLLDDKMGLPDDYSSDKTYEVGDTVTHDGKVYRCKSKISTAEEWTEAHWEKVDLYAETGKLQAESLEHYASIEILKKETADQNLIDNRNYPGRDLKVVFADEIEEAGDEWEWIQKRADKGDFSGLRNEDWISFELDGQTYDAQPAGMDTYYETGYAEQHGAYDTTSYVPIPHHIDFITKQCMPTGIKWNETKTNSGTGTENDDGTDVPWLTCNLKKQLGTLFDKLPENLKKHITEKVMLLERRASKPDAPLTASTGWHWYPMGKLWVPTEYEVFGSVIWGTPGWSAGQAMQYPLFAHNWKHTLKHKAGTSERCYWWLASVSGRYATHACHVRADGHAYAYLTTDELCAPLCFRITANPS